MTSCADLRVLFRAPAGLRRGFGHLVRCRSLARVLGVRPLVALRGGAAVREAALGLGCDVVQGGPERLLRALAPDVLIVDDPVAADARRWIAAGRRAGCLVVSVHDLGLGCLDADRDPFSVLVALGGGPRAELALDIAEAIVDAHPRATVRVAGGFVSMPAPVREQISRVGPTQSLRHEMARASVGAVGGGVSLYEACALGTPGIGVPVVAAQRPTVASFVARGAAHGSAGGGVSAERVADECVSLLSDAAMRRHLSRLGRRLIGRAH